MMRSLVILLMLATSCTFTQMKPGGEFQPCVCTDWKNPLSCKETCPLSMEHPWWIDYQDPCLDTLEQEAVENNYDLQIAAARILQAKALVGIAFSNRLPHANLDFSYTRREALVTLADFGLGSKDVRIEEKQITFPLDLCYEIDFWGKYRNLNAAARERFFASEYNQKALFVSLTTEVAALYFSLRTLDEEILYLEKAVAVREDYLTINAERYQRGLDCEIDVTRAKLDLALAQTDLEETKRLRGQTENALALILGHTACSFSLSPGFLPKVSLCPPPGLPSTLIARRPDIQEKMHTALSALQIIGVAKAEFFPQFSITAALGVASPSFSTLFDWQSRLWAVAVNACQVLFDGGRILSNLALRKAEYLQTILEYHKQVAIAFKEVEDALNEIHHRCNQIATQEQAVLFSEDTALLARNQYEAGLINYLLVADAEKTQLNARKAFIRLNGRLYMARVQLIKALGGGFNISECYD